ncbi:maltose ABC transporter substrate-binding protein [Paenibacillus cisolokensis]|uniref:sugar ABC transporter substrate-binding protein n=1 Tax=Paenibacillus cisolokensis TaxID=1658519 RepID=UPI003D2C9DD9
MVKIGKRGIWLIVCFLVFSLAACAGGSGDPKPANGESQAGGTANEGGGSEKAGGEETAGEESAGEEAAGDDIVPEEGAKLIVWEGKEEKPFLEAMIAEFTAKYNIPVELQEVNAHDQIEKIKKDGPAGVGADVLVMPHDALGRAIAAGVVLPNDWYAEDTIANFVAPAVEAFTHDGMLYGTPRNVETYLLYYNKSLVKPEDLASWESIKAFAKSFNDPPNRFGILWKLDDSYFNYSFIAGYGGYVFGNKGTDPTDIGLNNEGAVEGMKFFQSMREVVPIKVADATNDLKTDLFQKQKLAINMDGVWQMSNFTTEKLGFEVGAVPLPPMPGDKRPIAFAGVKGYLVSSFSKYPNAAKLFIHYVTSEQAMVKNYEMTGIIPARNGMDQNEAIKNNEIAAAFLEQFKYTEAMPSIVEMDAFWSNTMGALFTPIWDGADVKQTLDKTVENMKTSISQLQQ